MACSQGKKAAPFARMRSRDKDGASQQVSQGFHPRRSTHRTNIVV